MIFTKTCSQGLQALIRLAAMRPTGSVRVKDLCRGTNLSPSGIAKLFHMLAREGLLRSAKGRGGGFAFARSPSRITLLNVVAAIDGMDLFDACAVGLAKCDEARRCPLHTEWTQVRDRIKEFFATTSLEHMAQVQLAVTPTIHRSDGGKLLVAGPKRRCVTPSRQPLR